MITQLRNTRELNKASLRVAVIKDLLSRNVVSERSNLIRELQGIGAVVADAMVYGRTCDDNDSFLQACECLALQVAMAYLKA